MREYDLSTAQWRKSSYSDGTAATASRSPTTSPAPPPGARAATATATALPRGLRRHPGIVPVRDSKTPHGPALVFTAPRWTAFIDAVKDGHFPAP